MRGTWAISDSSYWYSSP